MNYIKQLTFLRFLAAILVVLFHYGRYSWPFNTNEISKVVLEGSIAVSFFFFLSGVVLSVNYLYNVKFNFKTFLIKRFARIYPVYILAFIITLVLAMSINNSYPKGLSIILQILNLHAWVPGICLEINYPAWSISVEAFFYMLFPVIIFLFRRLNNTQISIIVIFIWLLSIAQHYYFVNNLYQENNIKIQEFILYFPLWHLNIFLVGMLCGIFIKEYKISKKLSPKILYTIGILMFFVVFVTDNPIKAYVHNGLLAPVFFLIVAGLAIDKSLLTKLLGHNMLVLLGNASYSVYILQWPLFIVFSKFLNKEKLIGIDFYIYLVSLIIISIFVYLFFEKKAKHIILKKLIRSSSKERDTIQETNV